MQDPWANTANIGAWHDAFRNIPMFIRDPDALYTYRTLQLVNGGFPLVFGGKGHVSNGCNMYLLRSPAHVMMLSGIHRRVRHDPFRHRAMCMSC